MKRLLSAVLFATALLAALAPTCAAGERRVVVIVWPGLRPELVSEDNTPTLMQMMAHGTTFRNHHAVFPSSLTGNLVAIATGATPSANGLLADTELIPGAEPLKPVLTADPKTIEAADIQTNRHYLKPPTIAEILRANKPPLYTDTAGSDVIALLADREYRSGAGTSRLLASGSTLPTIAVEDINESLGVFPSITGNNKTARDTWTTAALTDAFWAEKVPTFSMLILAEPAYSAAANGPASYAASEALSLCDGKLSMIFAALQKRGILQDTDIFLVGTNGMSETATTVNFVDDLNHLGVKARASFITPPKKGDIMVVPNDGCAFIYITGHDPNATARTLEAIRKLDYAGTLFTRNGAEGTFPLELAQINTPDAPDIVLSYRWTDATATGGLRGKTPSSSAAKGTSGSLSPHEMQTLMVACGPGFTPATEDTLPTGNTDIAPTILWLLGLTQPETMNGRVLAEALQGAAPTQSDAKTATQTVSATTPSGEWTQYLKTSTIGNTRYLDEGNASLATNPASQEK